MVADDCRRWKAVENRDQVPEVCLGTRTTTACLFQIGQGALTSTMISNPSPLIDRLVLHSSEMQTGPRPNTLVFAFHF